MKVTVTGRQVTVSEATHRQIDKKLARLDRLLNGSYSAFPQEVVQIGVYPLLSC